MAAAHQKKKALQAKYPFEFEKETKKRKKLHKETDDGRKEADISAP